VGLADSDCQPPPGGTPGHRLQRSGQRLPPGQPEWIALPGCAFLAGCPVSVLEAARLLTARQITQDRTRFEVRHWRQPTTAEVAMEAGVGAARIVEVLRHASEPLSLCEPFGHDRDDEVGDRIASEHAISPFDAAATSLLCVQVARLQVGFDDREREISTTALRSRLGERRTPRRGRGLLRAHPRANSPDRGTGRVEAASSHSGRPLPWGSGAGAGPALPHGGSQTQGQSERDERASAI
jgi:hypothetical protein